MLIEILSYISTKFKEQFGMGINEYINKFRIKKAKELLNTENYTLDTVSSMVGYTDSRTFIRIFKKYEDTTPGKYRKSSV
ncbi:MAG: helix-turn-helix transcriptional regulator [Clostridia bacterium]|nr:helix-turn-helix transcriptional regulator [Clostridia bacterium]